MAVKATTKRIMIAVPEATHEVLTEARKSITNDSISMSKFILYLALNGLDKIIQECLEEEGGKKNENN